MIKQKEKSIIYSSFGENLIITPYGENAIRFRASANMDISEEKWCLLEPTPVTPQIEVTEEKAIMRNGNITVEILQNGAVSYYKTNGEILLSEKWWDERNNTALLHHGREYRHKGGELYQIKLYFNPCKEEHFYGLGQDPNDCFDLKGTTAELCQKNTRVSIPFLISSKGYGFLWNNPGVGRAELVNNHTMWFLEGSRQIDYIIIAEDSPREIIKRYSQLVGKPPRFPHWASGFWQSKLRYETQDDLIEVAKEYKRRNIPISVIVIDFFHWTQQGDWKFDSKYWPDPKKMVQELKNMGIELVVSVWPTVDRKSENYRELAENNYIIKAENGYQGLLDFFGPQTFIDVTNEDARKYVWDKIKKNYFDYGIHSYWLDVAEPEFRPYHYDNMRMSIGNGIEVSQIYPFMYEKMIYDGLISSGETEVITLSRSAWIGSQRLGALVWSGDIASSFDSLRRQVRAGLNMSMSGIQWWTTDIGGFVGGKPHDSSFRELLARWLQFGLFLPVMRIHGWRLWEEGKGSKHTEILCATGADNEIWSFGEKVCQIASGLIKLREKMRPYIQKHMDIASEEGIPIMRPLFFDYPEDERCYSIDDQYMFGDDVLFAPIVNEGQIERNVYLPNGKWIRTSTKEIYDGGTEVACEAKINDFIAFVKKGSEIIEIF